jgi:alkanesulfonate monooxygenase SsuD/methylene tetrahydromethanopterin reductase-like flavin-dependent oxidoreductase (luciferase family)
LFSNPPGLLRADPHARSRRDRIGSGAGSNATAVWAAEKGMNLQSSTLENDEEALPLHVQQANQIRASREAWKAADHRREPWIFVSRSIFILVDGRDRDYFGRGNRAEDSIGYIDETTRAIFGRSYAGEPDALIESLGKDEAIAEADPLLSTVRTSSASATTRTSPSRS